MKYTFTAVFREENGKVFARVPDLDGCVTTGKDFSDALEQMKDALCAWLCVAEDESLSIPAPRPQNQIEHTDVDVLSLISADTIKYRAKTDSKAVQKSVSLPAWLLQ